MGSEIQMDVTDTNKVKINNGKVIVTCKLPAYLAVTFSGIVAGDGYYTNGYDEPDGYECAYWDYPRTIPWINPNRKFVVPHTGNGLYQCNDDNFLVKVYYDDAGGCFTIYLFRILHAGSAPAYQNGYNYQDYSSVVVAGTDGKLYLCVDAHTGADDKRPVTGANWDHYWEETPSTCYTPVFDSSAGTGIIDDNPNFWNDSTRYKVGDVILCGSEKYDRCVGFRCKKPRQKWFPDDNLAWHPDHTYNGPMSICNGCYCEYSFTSQSGDKAPDGGQNYPWYPISQIPTWSSATTYSENAVIQYSGNFFKSREGSNINHTPSLDLDDYWWFELPHEHVGWSVGQYFVGFGLTSFINGPDNLGYVCTQTHTSNINSPPPAGYWSLCRSDDAPPAIYRCWSKYYDYPGEYWGWGLYTWCDVDEVGGTTWQDYWLPINCDNTFDDASKFYNCWVTSGGEWWFAGYSATTGYGKALLSTDTTLPDPWELNHEYSVGNMVIGSDAGIFACEVAHTSTADDCPITGQYWTNKWIRAGC